MPRPAINDPESRTGAVRLMGGAPAPTHESRLCVNRPPPHEAASGRDHLFAMLADSGRWTTR